ncbi:AzlC family ABC transporter permease [Halobellus rubicundus]|uniref:AzlC family ABC transporter permease n=1 Tax=Halobellus rubicundus TaxID=2996466 RepID=A0ABD5M6F2_9EURY
MSRASLPPEVARGLRDAGPVLIGFVPFGLVAGAAGVDAGLTPLQTIGLSVVVFAGASQLAAIDLFGRNAELLVVVLTGVVINLRMLMYSASIAPRFRPLRAWWKTACAYVLTDQAYALSIARYSDEDLSPSERRNYYLTVAVSLWLLWQVCTILGIVVGARVPDSWGLEFAVPLVFLGLLVPTVTSPPKAVAAIVGGTVALAGSVFAAPFNLGLIAGGVVGVVAGVATDAVLGSADDEADSEPGGGH